MFNSELVWRAIRASQLQRRKPARMRGWILFQNRGIQTVRTDSRIHPIVKLWGDACAPGAAPGDAVGLEYRVDPRAQAARWVAVRT